MAAAEEHGNRLAREASAYLLQHARNPVDWYPWGEEALARARSEERPLLISIGYSSCHWCHVMERESFEDAATAALMNEHFVCIKVDREERPDVDQIYMDTVVRLTGHGGWPLTVFCRPDGSPFYGGTYYPDEPRHGMPSFRQVLAAVSQAWNERRHEVDEAAARIVESLAQRLAGETGSAPGSDAVCRAARLIMRSADWKRGGFGDGPKFPTPTNLELLLCALDFLAAEEAEAVARHLATTCSEMARRGLFDHLGGGFHRYCVDGGWTIPHFEKMLYDQGLLLSVYAEMLRRSGNAAELEWPIRETVAYLRREMRSPEGGFHASQDADAEGVEGAYNVWTPKQIEAVLGERAGAFARAYGVEQGGNFEHGTSHLIDVLRAPRADFAEERAALLAARQQRVAPETDRKRVAAWNGYVISGLARAGSLLDDAEMRADAREAFDFVQGRMIDDEGRLYRVFNRGRASVPAFLDDHAALLEASLELYRGDGGEACLLTALHLADQIVERFFDEASGELYFTPADGESLVHRPRSDQDGATPAAAGLAVLGLLRLGQLTDSSRLLGSAERVIGSAALELERAPHALPTLLRAVALQERGLSLALVVGEPGAADTLALAARARRVLLPDDLVVVKAPGAERPPGIAASWLEGREPKRGQATAWVCRGTRCSLPVTSPEQLAPL